MAIVYSGDNITFGDGSIIAGVATQNNVYNVVTANANTSTGNSYVTFTSNTATINAGMIIYAAGFGRGVTVSSVVNANTILLSSAAANTATNTRISFVEPNRVVTADVAAPGLCKAWVNFNGTGTVAIRAAFNISSITDGGTGVYTANFTTAMPDINFTLIGTAGTQVNSGVDNGVVCSFNRTSTSNAFFNTRNVQSSGAAADYDSVNIAIFR
jgi:hypothetical protein